MDTDARQKSDAAQERFLAELEKEGPTSTEGKGGTKEKSRDKKKSRDVKKGVKVRVIPPPPPALLLGAICIRHDECGVCAEDYKMWWWLMGRGGFCRKHSLPSQGMRT